MEYTIQHATKDRLRLGLKAQRLRIDDADKLQAYLAYQFPQCAITVHERTANIIIRFVTNQSEVLEYVRTLSWDMVKASSIEGDGSRALAREYEDKLMGKLATKVLTSLYLPMPFQIARTAWHALPFLWKGIKVLARREMKVELLDAISIGASLVMRDFSTAGEVIFLLELGELLEEWTHKKSVKDLAASMSLHVDQVWLVQEEQEILVPLNQIQEGDEIVLRMGDMIPVDGQVVSGDAMVNQASMTGEGVPVAKQEASVVYAGTSLEQVQLRVRVTQKVGAGRYDKIIHLIEQNEARKSQLENRAFALADKLVPYTLAGSALTYLLTRNLTRALSVLMVDFSCALKLAMPLAVMSGMRQASYANVRVKGGKYLEAFAKADAIVFDKTGTLTHAHPEVVDVIALAGMEADEMLRLAACLEEHFPHSMANAVVEAAKKKGLEHDEFHSEVDYVVAHGIVSHVANKRVLIGSAHFVFEDEGIPYPDDPRLEAIDSSYSRLYMAMGDTLVAVICITDPLRKEACSVMNELRQLGLNKLVMLTGDNKVTAARVAKEVGVDTFYGEVLPEDKANYVKELKEAGHTVVMVGDGINDSPALSSADVGIAIRDGAAIASDIADITMAAQSLEELVYLRRLAMSLMERIDNTYHFVIGFNSGLIGLGALGLLSPGLASLLHNESTLAISMRNMSDYPLDRPELLG